MKVTEIGIKEGRIHCCDSDCCQRDSAEHEGYDRVLTEKRITENNITDADSEENGLLEQILEPRNLNQAYKQVKKNKGSHGVDGMEVEHLLRYFKDNGEELRKSILEWKIPSKTSPTGRNTKGQWEEKTTRDTDSGRQGCATSHTASAVTNLRSQVQ